MRYFLDTHTLIWWRQNDPRLPRAWDAIFDAPREHEILFSTISLWEIAIKRGLGKLQIQGDLSDFARTLQTDHRFHQLPLEITDICRLEKLPPHHRDPFDRLLIAQAIEQSAIAVTDDPKWKPYPLRVEF
ncbi:MAG: type II toxin-antitoxin system VapC family toxin [Chthoniobacterales bacterium]|jgi:PIN domain nuclease of toxin-antitoxin system